MARDADRPAPRLPSGGSASSSAGTQLWSERFETSADAIFEVQDDIVARIAAILVARLEETTLRRSRRKPTRSLAAYELTLRGLMLLRQGTLEADEEARGLFQSALALDAMRAPMAA